MNTITPTTKKPKLLILESDADNCEYAAQEYEALGYDVVAVPLVDRSREEYIEQGHINHDALNADINASKEGSFRMSLEKLSPHSHAIATNSDLHSVLQTVKPDAVLCDYHLDCVELDDNGYACGLKVMQRVRHQQPGIATVMHAPSSGTAQFRAEIAEKAAQDGLALATQASEVDAALRSQLQTTPGHQVHDVEKQKPRLMIFDDDSVLLARFTQQYRERGYEVTPVLVADGRNDALMEHGLIRQGNAAPVTDEEMEHYHDPVRTVASELKLARAKTRANPNRDRFATDLAIYEAMTGFKHGVKSKDEVRSLMQQVKPDAVLSDMQMRRPEDPDMPAHEQAANPDVIMGDHIMAMTAELLPKAPRAIHTGQYTIDEYMREVSNETQLAAQQALYAKLCAAHDARARGEGYRVFAKDGTGKAETANAVDALFREQLHQRPGRAIA